MRTGRPAGGVRSLRPAHSRVSAYGALPLAHPLDAVRPGTRRMRDVRDRRSLLAKGWSVLGGPALSVPVGLPEREADLVGLGIALDEHVRFWTRTPLDGSGSLA